MFVKPVTYTVSKFFASTRPAGRSAGRPGGRPGGARVVSGAEKKSFDRGGPVWPPRSNVTNDRLRGGPVVVTRTGLAHKIFFILSLNFLLGELRKKIK